MYRVSLGRDGVKVELDCSKTTPDTGTAEAVTTANGGVAEFQVTVNGTEIDGELITLKLNGAEFADGAQFTYTPGEILELHEVPAVTVTSPAEFRVRVLRVATDAETVPVPVQDVSVLITESDSSKILLNTRTDARGFAIMVEPTGEEIRIFVDGVDLDIDPPYGDAGTVHVVFVDDVDEGTNWVLTTPLGVKVEDAGDLADKTKEVSQQS
ncbi:MAG: hypothetical protein ABIJ92_00755 [Candidatus Aenigmatarchaeota archaeon]